MTIPKQINFSLTSRNVDYIEFRLSYFIGDDDWKVDCIGWMECQKPTYYARNLVLNSVVANARYTQALLTNKELSLKFKHKELHEFTLLNIRNVFTKPNKIA